MVVEYRFVVAAINAPASELNGDFHCVYFLVNLNTLYFMGNCIKYSSLLFYHA